MGVVNVIIYYCCYIIESHSSSYWSTFMLHQQFKQWYKSIINTWFSVSIKGTIWTIKVSKYHIIIVYLHILYYRLPDIIKCTICPNIKKYSHSKSGLPLCSLECYKKLHQLSANITAGIIIYIRGNDSFIA